MTNSPKNLPYLTTVTELSQMTQLALAWKAVIYSKSFLQDSSFHGKK